MSGYTTLSLRQVTGPTVITAPNATTTALTILGQSGQSAPYLNIIRNSNGQPALQVSDGSTLSNNALIMANPIRNNTATLTLGAITDFGVLVLGPAGSNTLTVRGASGQSVPPFLVQNSTPSTIFSVDQSGNVFAGGNVRAGTQLAGTGLMDTGFTYSHLTLSNTDTIVNPASSAGIALRIRGAASQSTDLLRLEDSTPTTLASIDKIGRIQFPGIEAITASAGAAAGTSPPAPVPGGNDIRGYVTFGTGTGPAAGIMCHVAFTTAFAAAPVPVISPTNGATAALGLYALNFATTGFDVAFNSAPAASQANTTYGFSFAVLG